MTSIYRNPNREGRALAACAAISLLLLLSAGQARAATDVYPAGGSTFSGGAQGWEVTEASCNVPVLCTAAGGYDGANGNPPGSIAANTTITLNLLTLFKSTVTLAVAGLHGRRWRRRHAAPRPPVRLRLAWSTWRRRPPTTSP